jgi:diaminopimelate decarboxylase
MWRRQRGSCDRSFIGVSLTELNIVGGQGVPYLTCNPELDLDALRDFIDDGLNASCAAGRSPRPTIVVEPGRAISARRYHALSGPLGAVTMQRPRHRRGGRRIGRQSAVRAS